jgi:predicted RNA polymerase sigma factor
MINSLRPADAEVEGCLALMLITHARRAARVDEAGATVTLTDQNRSLWDHSAIAEGTDLIVKLTGLVDLSNSFNDIGSSSGSEGQAEIRG